MSEFSDTMKAKYLTKTAYIRKLPNGKYRVYSEKGKNMGTFDSEKAAKKHLGEIEFFKHKADDNMANEQATYSSIVRKLRKEGDEEKLVAFLKTFKEAFDHLALAGEKDPAEKALPITLFLLSRKG
jgi:hypothetical protein